MAGWRKLTFGIGLAALVVAMLFLDTVRQGATNGSGQQTYTYLPEANAAN